MCGRFTQQRPASELAEIFAAEPLADELGARYNVAPTDEASVVVQREDRRAVTAYRWGLVPHWATDAKGGSRMFNARAETITASPAFREAFRRRRCIVPVDSFYEWKREGTVRQPYRVVARRRPAARAGGAVGRLARPGDGGGPPHVHDRDHDPERGDGRSARSDARRAGRSGWDRWLIDGRAGPTVDEGELLAMLRPTDDVELRIYPVNRYVNDVRRDGPELIEPLSAAAITAATATAEGTLGL